MPASGPLGGIRVLEISRVLTGAYCSMVLADMGADVIKIERPEVGDDSRHYGPPFLPGGSYYFHSVNRNKRSVVLDLRTPAGRSTLQQIASESDVLVHNYMPGTSERLGFAYESLAPLAPQLIYCAIAGFSRLGSRRDKSSLDVTIQALGGAMSITGEHDGPPLRSPLPIADLSGALFATCAILAALYERKSTGTGQRIDVPLLQSLAAIMPYHWGDWFVDGKVPQRRGNSHPSMVPYNSYATTDGHVALAVNSDEQWMHFCQAMSADDLLRDSTLTTNTGRVARREDVDKRVAALFANKTSDQVVKRLESTGVPCGKVMTMEEASAELRSVAGLIESFDGATSQLPPVIAPPYVMSAHKRIHATRPPFLGEHSREVLEELDLAQSAEHEPSKE